MDLRTAFLFFLFFVIAGQSFADSEESGDSVFFPIGFYQPETGVGLGLIQIFNHEAPRPGKYGHTLSLLSFTTRGQGFLSVKPLLYFKEGHHEFGPKLSARYSPSRYFGVGSNSFEEPEKFLESSLELGVSYGVEIFPRAWVKFTAGHERLGLSAESEATEMQLVLREWGSQIQISSVGIVLEYDGRDFTNSPRQGHLARVSGQGSQAQASGGLTFFQKYEADARFYQSLGSGVVAASQGHIGLIQGDRVPFQTMFSIGGAQRLRGYYMGRFRDQADVMIQLELRKEYSERWGTEVFAGVARLADQLSHLGDQPTRSSMGLGGFYFLEPKGRVKLRLDLAFSSLERGVYFSMGDAF